MLCFETLLICAGYFVPLVQAVTIGIASDDPGITYIPSTGSWAPVNAPGAYNAGNAKFLLNNRSQGIIEFTFPVPSGYLEFWGYQRSDGGIYSISFDNITTEYIDVYNATSTGNDGPLLLFTKRGLPPLVHQVTITNLFDIRVNRSGQMNLDHIALDAPPSIVPSFPPDTFLVEVPVENCQVNLSLGAAASVNGGSGGQMNVLLDAGSDASWIAWSGCSEALCTSHQNAYTPSTQHFTNFTLQDSIAYATGGPEYTYNMWRVNDTVQFGNVAILSTPLDAAYHLGTGIFSTSLDGIIGMAKSYCDGRLCALYPGFVESMYADGVIKAPVLSFYQLISGDAPAPGVSSVAAIGGIDRNKYVGNIDWIRTTNESMWIVPQTIRYVTSNGSTIDASPRFVHPKMIFDTGDPGLLGIPTGDWLTLVSIVEAIGPDSNGNYQFPCDSTMTWNFAGTQGTNYTFALADTTTNIGGYCSPLANDAGPIANWITGRPFFNRLYTILYFGERGVNSALGFAQKNLNASAATSSPVIGLAI